MDYFDSLSSDIGITHVHLKSETHELVTTFYKNNRFVRYSADVKQLGLGYGDREFCFVRTLRNSIAHQL